MTEYAYTSLSLNRVTISNANKAYDSYKGDVAISNSSLNGPEIYTYEGDISVSGSSFTRAGIETYDGNITVSGSSFSGARIYSYDGHIAVSGSSFRGSGANRGGAIETYDGNVTVSFSSFSQNSARTWGYTTGRGGAIYTYDGDITVSFSTFSNNSAPEGGAIYTFEGGMSVSNSTFSNNSAPKGGAIATYSGVITATHITTRGSIYSYRGTLNLRNSIIGGPVSTDKGTVNQANNLVGGDPKLGALTGSPAYFPLLAGSPAIDAADAAYCLSLDQTNVARPQGNGCDIGAFEYSSAPQRSTVAPTATPTAIPTPIPNPVSLNGSPCHLEDAIVAANFDRVSGGCPAGNGADTITFRSNVLLRRALPAINSAITFEGGGHSLSRYRSSAKFRLLYLGAGAKVAINNLTLSNGEATQLGGAIYSRGSLTINNSTLQDNEVSWYGGAIFSSGFADDKITARCGIMKAPGMAGRSTAAVH